MPIWKVCMRTSPDWSLRSRRTRQFTKNVLAYAKPVVALWNSGLLLPKWCVPTRCGKTIWAITRPFLSQTMYLFIARQFFYSVPDELIEAARIDGVSHAGAFFKIVCPMSKPLYATIAILAFTGTWNSYLVPATFINRIEKYTLVVGLQTVNMSFFQKTNLTMAGVVLLSFPVILFFIFNQKKFVQGVMSSGIKA